MTRPLATLLAGCLLLLAGCGSDDEEDPGTGTTATSGGIQLEVTLDPDGPGGDAPETAEVSCDGADCAAGAAGLEPADFEPVPAQAACTKIYGGPDTATVAGMLDGDPVEATLTRADGCQIDRFDRFTPLLRELFPGYEPGASLKP